MSKKSKKKDRKNKHKKTTSSPTRNHLDLRSVEIPPRPRPLKAGRDPGHACGHECQPGAVCVPAERQFQRGGKLGAGSPQPRQATLKLLHIAARIPVRCSANTLARLPGTSAPAPRSQTEKSRNWFAPARENDLQKN